MEVSCFKFEETLDLNFWVLRQRWPSSPRKGKIILPGLGRPDTPTDLAVSWWLAG
jgi:hypothetical protein